MGKFSGWIGSIPKIIIFNGYYDFEIPHQLVGTLRSERRKFAGKNIAAGDL